ncbi:hypothetical protein Ait01nite_058760 [Actinoplanes italicus]|nr:hypothetical protein Ait01nite_058760 [Actinoplanes italicus]
MRAERVSHLVRENRLSPLHGRDGRHAHHDPGARGQVRVHGFRQLVEFPVRVPARTAPTVGVGGDLRERSDATHELWGVGVAEPLLELLVIGEKDDETGCTLTCISRRYGPTATSDQQRPAEDLEITVRLLGVLFPCCFAE